MSVDEMEKKALKSKKFIAYMVAEFGWKAILVLIVLLTPINLWQTVLMISIAVISGFVQVGYVLGQASIDKYIRVAKINAGMITNKKEEGEE
jgi:uncharacterized membrane protein